MDVFTPIIDDPFTQGEIVACNATNDIFAMGVNDVVSLQALLAYPADLPEEIPAGIPVLSDEQINSKLEKFRSVVN